MDSFGPKVHEIRAALGKAHSDGVVLTDKQCHSAPGQSVEARMQETDRGRQNSGFSGTPLWRLMRERKESAERAAAAAAGAPAERPPPEGFAPCPEAPREHRLALGRWAASTAGAAGPGPTAWGAQDWLWHASKAIYWHRPSGRRLFIAERGGQPVAEEVHVGLDPGLELAVGSATTAPGGAERHVLIRDLSRAAQALKMPVEHLDRPCALLGIYTGHSGAACAQFCAKNFHLKLLPRLAQFPGRWLGDRLCASLVAVLAELEADFRARHPGAADACSAAVALVVGAQLAVCLAGRSACLLLGAGARAVPAAPPAGARRRALNEAAGAGAPPAAEPEAGCVGLGPAESCCLLLGASAAEAAAGRPEAAAACLALGARPRAACGQLLAAAGRRGEGGEGTAAAKEGMAAAAAFLSWRGAAAEDGAAAEPSRKRPRVQDKEASQVRVRHILVKHRDVKGALDKVRSRPVRRSQWEAEDLLRGALCDLAMVEGQPKKCSELFTQRCRELSECASALKGGEFAGDLGWLARGGKKGPAEKAIEEAAFGLRVGQLSDLIVTESGVHLLYRSA